MARHFSPDTHVIHLEGDMLVLPDFPLRVLTELKGPAWMSLDEGVDMPGLISIKCSDLPELINQILQTLEDDPSLNDMEILHRIRKSESLGVQLLPSLPDSKQGLGNRFVSQRGVPILFDPAYYAQWFIGEDPRNAWGIVKRKRPLRQFLSLDDFQLVKNAASGLSMNGRSVELDFATLHLHSKELKFFSGEKFVDALVKRGRKKTNAFSLYAAISSLMDTARHVMLRIQRTIVSK